MSHNMSLSEYLKDNYSRATAKAYEREILIYLGNMNEAEKAMYKDIVSYFGRLRMRYTNSKTIHRIVFSIKAYYEYLISSGKRKDNPAKSIKLRDKLSNDIQLQDLFTAEELESLLNKLERYNNLDYRNKVLMSLLIYQALQPKELESLTIKDINLHQGTIYIKSTPTTNRRELSLKPTQIMLFYQYIFKFRSILIKNKSIENLIVSQRGEAMNAQDISSHVKRIYGNRFPGRKVSSQTIRQSVITNLLKAGNDLRVVQTFAGHKHPSTTEKYKQNKVEELKAGINKYHPLQ